MLNTKKRICLSLAILFLPLVVVWLTANWDSPLATAAQYALAVFVSVALTRLLKHPWRKRQRTERETDGKG